MRTPNKELNKAISQSLKPDTCKLFLDILGRWYAEENNLDKDEVTSELLKFLDEYKSKAIYICNIGEPMNS